MFKSFGAEGWSIVHAAFKPYSRTERVHIVMASSTVCIFSGILRKWKLALLRPGKELIAFYPTVIAL